MSKPLDRQRARLRSRQAAATVAPSKGLHKPGSMNRHKTAAASSGKRTRDKISADSRSATQR